MCDPVSAAVGIGTVASIGGNILEQNAQSDRYNANGQAAVEAAVNSKNLITLRQAQESRASAQTIYQMDLQARRAQAELATMAGESGVQGTSVDLLLADVDRQASWNRQGIQQNLENSNAQADAEKKSVDAQMQSQINSVAKPNPMAGLLRIGGSVAGGLTEYTQLRAKGTVGNLNGTSGK